MIGSISVRQLIQQYRAHNPEGMFFNRDALSHYGEHLHDMTVSGKGVVVNRSGDVRICWELRTVQRHPLLGKRTKRYYFDIDTYEEVMPDDGETTTPWEKEVS